MSRQDDWDRGYDRPPSGGGGAITGAAVINFVAGGLILALGMCALIGMMTATAGRGGGFMMGGPGGMALAYLLVFGMIVWAVLCIVAGVGIIGRKSYGRVLGLVCASIGILFALYYLWTLVLVLSVLGAPGVGLVLLVTLLIFMIFVLHTIWNFSVLLSSQNAAHFR